MYVAIIGIITQWGCQKYEDSVERDQISVPDKSRKVRIF